MVEEEISCQNASRFLGCIGPRGKKCLHLEIRLNSIKTGMSFTAQSVEELRGINIPEDRYEITATCGLVGKRKQLPPSAIGLKV